MRTAFLLVLLPLFGAAQPPTGYYDSTYGLSGEPLREALRDIIDNHSVQTYGSLWGHMQTTDDRPDGKVWDIYSDVPGTNEPYLYNFVSDQCGTYSGEGDCFNREHSFPLSWFNDATPMNSDLFHIYPTDGWVNQKRGNLAYGEVSNPSWTSQNGSKVGPCALQGCGSDDVFEPIDLYKGDLARSYFYMLTRYMDQTGNWTSCPMLAGGEFTQWAENMLLAWHALDPVDSKETDRNNAIFGIQDNRNPYIDNPGWVYAIWGPTADIAEVGNTGLRAWVTDGVLYLSGPMDGTDYITVVDALGRTELQAAVTTNNTLIGDRLSAGLHLAVVSGEWGRVALRFLQP
ncbi:MAG: endonuclease [Flavobacteriales bacterium]